MEVEVEPCDLDVNRVSSSKQQGQTRNRIPQGAIVGTGFVGATTAYALLMSGISVELVLIDRDRKRADGHVQDLRDAEVFSHSIRVFAGVLGDCCSADITIITACVSQSAQKSRMDGLKETAAMLKGVVTDLSRLNPHGILLIASNPVDVLTYTRR
jgi:L-lactate dehydrogenase